VSFGDGHGAVATMSNNRSQQPVTAFFREMCAGHENLSRWASLSLGREAVV